MSKSVKAPSWLMDKEEAKLFRQILSLDEGEVLKKSDTLILAMLVDAIIDFRVAKQDIEENGVIITTVGERGFERTSASPYVAMKKEARQTIIKSCQELGFTPKARAALDAVVTETGEKGALQQALTDLIKARSDRRG